MNDRMGRGRREWPGVQVQGCVVRIELLGLVILGLLAGGFVSPAQAQDAPPSPTSGIITEAAGTSDPAKTAPSASKLSPKLTLESADGRNSLTFGLRVQMLLQLDSTDFDDADTADTHTEFKFRRIRTSFKGRLFAENLSYFLQFNLSPGSLELLDATLNVAFTPQVQLEIGQAKAPFTRYRQNSDKDQMIADWALVSPYFGTERQLGLTLHNGKSKPPRIEYQAGIYSGRNARKSHGVGVAKMYGEKLTSPSSLTDPAPQDEFHPGLAAHIAYNHAGINTRRFSDFKKGGFRFSSGLSSSVILRPKRERDMALRLAPEFLLKVHGYSLALIYYLGVTEATQDDHDWQVGFHGFLLQTGYLLNDWVELAFSYAFVATTGDLRQDARKHAENILAQAEADERDDLTEQYGQAGNVLAEHEFVAALNFHFFDSHLVLKNDVGFCLHDYRDGVDDRNDLRVRVLLQLAI